MRSALWIFLLMIFPFSGWTQAEDNGDNVTACVANFHDDLDSQDPLTIHFKDESSGQITHWQWSFGDGVTSTEQSPVHTFLAEGTYIVCLTVFNNDPGNTCHDAICKPVTVTIPPVCDAIFTAELDSMNHAPNTFKFNNHSTGNPTSYLWTFDDGATYPFREVIHQFQTAGEHEVCLRIINEKQGVILCRDSVCHKITTAKYFNLGGHMFAGTYPINNPVSTGDTGLAFLYRKNGNNLALFDMARFTNLGYYAFPNVLKGNYIVRTTLTPGSARYSKYFQGYFPNELMWKESSVLQLNDSSMFSSNIYLSHTIDTLSGPGRIMGTVVPAAKADNPGGIPFAEVILYDEYLTTPLKFAVTDESGNFEIGSLPFGAYKLYVDFPGKYSRLTAVWLDSSTPEAYGMNLQLFEHDVTGIDDITRGSIVSSELFPNPAGSSVSVIIHPGNSATLKFEILDMTGRNLYSATKVCLAGSNLITLPVSQIPSGIYLFAVKTMEGSVILIKKMVK